MSRTSRILASASLGYLQLALSTVFGLLVTPFFLRRLGQHDFGLWSIATPMLTYLGLVDFGIITILQREISYAFGAASGDVQKMNGLADLVGKTVRLVVWQTAALCVLSVIVWIEMPRSWAGLRGPLAIVLASLVITFPLRMSHPILIGLQDLRFVAAASIVGWAAGLATGVVLVWSGFGVYGLAISWLVGQVVGSVIGCIRVFVVFPIAIPRWQARMSRQETFTVLGKGAWLIVWQLSAILLNGSDVIVIGGVLGPDAVTPYTMTDKLVTLFATLPLYVLQWVQPVLSEMRFGPDRSRLADAVTAVAQATLLASGFLVVLVIVVDRGFVAWWVGPSQFAGQTVAVLLAVCMLLFQWVSVTNYALFPFGQERRAAIVALTNGLATVVATYFLARRWGSAGAPLAGCLGFLLIGLPANLVVVAREAATRVSALIWPTVPWLWRFALLAGCAMFVGRWWTPDSFFKLATTSLAVLAVYGLTMLPLLDREPFGSYVRPRIATARARLFARTG